MEGRLPCGPLRAHRLATVHAWKGMDTFPFLCLEASHSHPYPNQSRKQSDWPATPAGLREQHNQNKLEGAPPMPHILKGRKDAGQRNQCSHAEPENRPGGDVVRSEPRAGRERLGRSDDVVASDGRQLLVPVQVDNNVVLLLLLPQQGPCFSFRINVGLGSQRDYLVRVPHLGIVLAPILELLHGIFGTFWYVIKNHFIRNRIFINSGSFLDLRPPAGGFDPLVGSPGGEHATRLGSGAVASPAFPGSVIRSPGGRFHLLSVGGRNDGELK